MSETAVIMLLFAAVLVAGGGIGVLAVRRRLRRISRLAFGTDSLLEGLSKQEELIAATPKSVAGMTRICLPRIEKDFPEFSYPEILQKSENQLKAALAAVEKQDPACLGDASGELERQIRLWIEDDKRQGIREQFQNIRIHQTEITRYEKKPGSCVIVLQSAVEYRYAKWQEEKDRPEPERTQTRYNMEWVYVQDIEQIPDGAEAVGVTCPNCGAPVRMLGARVCEYCGSALEALNIRVWSLSHIEEI